MAAKFSNVPSAVEELKEGGLAEDVDADDDPEAVATDEAEEELLLPLAGGLLPRPQIEKSKSSAL